MTCHELKTTLASWMHKELECEDRGKDRFVLTLPLLKPNGDSIDLGLERLSDRWRISDMGNTHATLFLSGVDLAGVRGVEFKEIKQSFKIVESGRELLVESAPSQVGGAVFEFVHAIQSILSLQLTVAHRPVKRDFPAVVARFFAEHRTSFEVPARGVQGKTGIQPFNFVLNHNQPPTLVKALSAGDRRAADSAAKLTVFEVGDVRLLRGPTKAAVIADDEGRRAKLWDADLLRVFDGYDIPVYRFLNDNAKLTELAESYRG